MINSVLFLRYTFIGSLFSIPLLILITSLVSSKKKVFQSTRIHLTIFYFFVIMFISTLTTGIMGGVIIRANTKSIGQESVKEFIAKNPKKPLPSNFQIDKKLLFNEAFPILLLFGVINVGVIIVAVVGGYFLSGKTLRPIKDMLDEQNRFVADASHELKTPLTALRTSLEVNLRDDNLQNKKIKNILERNLYQVVKLQSLTDNLLLLAQYEKEKKQVLKKVNIKEVIEESYHQIESLAKDKQISFELELMNTHVKGENELLTQLFIILFDNAIKYSAEKTKVVVKIAIKKSYVNVSIQDQGIGIAKEHISRIFDRFYQANSSRSKEKTGGYGLGLSIAKKIIEIHRGKIIVDSLINKGTTFSIQLQKEK